MFSGNRVRILNHQPDRVAAQLCKDVPFVGKMLIEHGVRITDLFSDLAKRHGFVTANGKHLAGSRKEFAPQPYSLRSTRRLSDVDVTSIAEVPFDDFRDRLLVYNHYRPPCNAPRLSCAQQLVRSPDLQRTGHATNGYYRPLIVRSLIWMGGQIQGKRRKRACI